MGDAAARKKAGDYPDKVRYQPGIVVVDGTAYHIDALGRAHHLRISARVKGPVIEGKARDLRRIVEPAEAAT